MAPEGIGTLEGITRSLLHGVASPFGVEADRDLQRWQAEHPVTALAAELAGGFAPFLGWARLARMGGPVGRYAAWADELAPAANPIVAGAVREMAFDAPLVAAMTGSSLLAGQDAWDTAVWAGIGTGIAGAVGGVRGAFRAAATEARKRWARVGVDLRAPPQLQLRQAEDLLAKMPDNPELVRTVEDIRREVLRETPRKAVEALEGAPPEAVRSINRFFTGRPEGRLPTRRLVPEDWADPKAFEDVLARSGFREDQLRYMQFPRVIQTRGRGSARGVLAALERAGAQTVAPQTWLVREPDDGMFIIARRFNRGPDAKRAAAGDEWLVFKTDAPGQFAPLPAKWASLTMTRASRFGTPEEVPAEGTDILGGTQKLMNDIPMASWEGIFGSRRGPVGELLHRTNGEVVPGLRSFLEEYFAPSSFQFRGARENWTHSIMRWTFGEANKITQRLLYGRARLKPGETAYSAILDRPEAAGGLRQLVDALSKDDLTTISDLFNRGIGVFDLGGLSPEARRLVQYLEWLDDYQVTQYNKTAAATGNRELSALKGHLSLSRTWRGDWRQRVQQGGRTVFMGSGKTRAEARRSAEAFIKENGGELKGDAFLSERGEKDVQLAKEMRLLPPDSPAVRAITRRASDPNFAKPRTGAGGYIGYNRPLSKDDLFDIVAGHTAGMQRKIAEMTVRAKLNPEFVKLARENPRAFQMLSRRLDDLSGRQGPIAAATNEVADRLLAPVLGKNSATKIVRALNTATMNLQLGMGNLLFPVMNALTFTQTVMPRAAFIVGSPNLAAKYYQLVPLLGSDRLVRQTIGVMDMWKLLRESFRQLKSTEASWREGLEQAMNEGVLAPRLVEEFIGQQNSNLKGAADALKRGEFWNVIRDVSEFLPGTSERFARTQAFSTGWLLGRDFLRLPEERLYDFAKRFTEDTMYLYSTSDRARIMTGPVGSLFGMFKNWTFHYIWQMADYVGAAKQGDVAPLLWMLGNTTALAGVGATPVGAVADLMSQWLTDKSLMLNIYEALGGREDSGIADAVMFGLPAYLPTLVGLPGISLSGATATPFSDPMHDIQFLTNFAFWQRASALGEAAGIAIDNWTTTGQDIAGSPGLVDAITRAFAPRSLQRIVAAQGDQILSLYNQYPSVGGLSFGESLLYQLGFAPTTVEIQWNVGRELWAKQAALRQAVQIYGERYAEAMAARDRAEATQLLRRAMIQGISVDSILRSAQSRAQKASETVIERQFSPQETAPYRRAGLV